MSATLLLCLLAASGCGGGGDDPADAAAPMSVAAAPSSYALAAAPATAPTPVAPSAPVDETPTEPDGAGTSHDSEDPEQTPDAALSKPGNAEAAQAVAGNGKLSTPAGDATTPAGALRRAALFTQLNHASGSASVGTRGIGATSLCREGFIPPADLVRTSAAASPAAGAVFFNPAELATWRERVRSGPFVTDGDFAPGSPGDAARIRANAERFITEGEVLAVDDAPTRSTHGQRARDAAFLWRLEGSSRALAAVRTWLLQQAAAPGNDFATQRCFTTASGESRDGWYAEAPWFARFVATYDFVRGGMAARDRITVENYIRRNAWFFATHVDWGMRMLFPQRHAGDYTRRGESAALTGEAVWWSRRVDSNGDCNVDGADDARSHPSYTHIDANGRLGNRISVLGQWFNNRRAANALAAGAAGLLLGDADLVERAKRYTMEWLTYAAYADGSISEYGRNGEYCIARQGLVYAAMNVHSGVMLARLLARQGDRSLIGFATRDGLFGSESVGPAARPKTLALVADTLLKASTGALAWYQAEPQKASQQPRESTSLGRARSDYQGRHTMDLMHELTLLSSASALPQVPVAETLAAHALLQRRSTVPVSTGLGTWSDAFGILPAAYLLRP